VLKYSQAVAGGASIETPKVKVIKKELQLYAGKHPALFSTLYRLKQDYRVVRPDTQLVIEGFPRSANTFSVYAFYQAQHEDVRIAHHLHYPAQVLRAAQWRIPALVLIRNPKDAVTSLLMRDPQPVGQALKHYIMFYRTVAKYREAYVVGRFEEVTGDYGAVVRRINDKFGTQFAIFDHTEQNVKKVYSLIEERHRTRNGGRVSETKIARPSTAKEEMRLKIQPSLEAHRQKRLMFDAMTIYDYLTSR
jgi:hypothetical protein